MGTIFGIEVPDPDDLISQRNQEFEAQKAQGDPYAYQSQALFNLFGGDESIRKARTVKQKLFEAQSSVKREPGESDFDYQMREATAIRNAVAGEAPDLAIAANERILELNTAKEEQRKLKATADTADLNLSSARKLAAQGARRAITLTDKNTGISYPVDYLPDGLSEQEQVEYFKDFISKHPEHQGYFDLTDGIDALKMQNLLSARALSGGSGGGVSGGLLNRSEIAKRQTLLSDSKLLAYSLGDVATNVADNPLALSPGVARFTNAVTAGAAFINEMKQLYGDDHYTGLTYTDESGNKQRIYSDAERSRLAEEDASVAANALSRLGGIEAFIGTTQMSSDQIQVIQGKTIYLAYQLAKTLDPGGRLSDQDVEMALRMLTGQGSPEAIAGLFQDRLRKLQLSRGAFVKEAQSGLYDSPGATTWRDEANAYEEALATAQQQVTDLFIRNAELRRQGKLFGAAAPATGLTREEKIAAARAKAQGLK